MKISNLDALRNKNLVVGETYETKGLDMNCKEVKTFVQFVRYLPEDEINVSTNYKGEVSVQDCVVSSNGIKMISNSIDYK